MTTPPDVVIHRGELVSPRVLRIRGLFFVLPGITWIGAFLALPCLALAFVAFARRGDYGNVEWAFSAENLKRLLGWDMFGWSADNLRGGVAAARRAAPVPESPSPGARLPGRAP